MSSTRPSERHERRGPAGAYCARCEGTTTHAGDVCVGCLARAENRRIGLVWLGLGVPVLLLAAAAIRSVPLAWPWTRNDRSMAGLALLLLLAGCYVAGRGLRAVLRGRSPDE